MKSSRVKVLSLSIISLTLLLFAGLVFSALMSGCFIVNDAANAARGISAKTLNADHILQNYEMYYQLYHDIKAKVNQYNSYDVTTGTENDKNISSIERRGIYGYITTTIEDYNAKSKMLNRKLFKDNNLPYQLKVIKEGININLVEE